jgi:hypothetical protein
MVYLEKEVQHLNKEIDEFEYSDEYLTFQSKGDASHLDALLGTQLWRKYKFDDVQSLRDEVGRMNGDGQTQYEYLLGEKAW